MFRGGDYVDDPGFHDLKGRPGYNYMDVSDIIGEDRCGNPPNSRNHYSNKFKTSPKSTRVSPINLPSPKDSSLLHSAANQIIMNSP
jgi:hypothetical protein